MKEAQIICVGCPLGCRATLKVSREGEVLEVTGCRCKEGRRYVVEEFHNPVRVLTATVLTEGSRVPLLAVRTSSPIPKEKLREAMKVLAKVRAKPPLRAGEVVLEDLSGTGVDLVATRDLPS